MEITMKRMILILAVLAAFSLLMFSLNSIAQEKATPEEKATAEKHLKENEGK